MKSMLTVLLISVFVSATTAQDYSNEDSLKHPHTALVFSFDGLDMEAFNGGVGARWWISDRFVLIGSMGLRYYDAESDREITNSTGEAQQWNFNFSIGMEWHLLPSNRVSPYIGLSIGPGLEDRHSFSVEGVINRQFERDEYALSFGANVILGVEYFLVEQVSLAAQYRNGITYDFWRYEESSFGERGKTENKSITGHIGKTSLLLSIYL